MLWFFWTLPVLLQRWFSTCLVCVHILTPRENRVRNILNNSDKNTIFNEHPVPKMRFWNFEKKFCVVFFKFLCLPQLIFLKRIQRSKIFSNVVHEPHFWEHAYFLDLKNSWSVPLRSNSIQNFVLIPFSRPKLFWSIPASLLPVRGFFAAIRKLISKCVRTP